jgi:hypothetical protein
LSGYDALDSWLMPWPLCQFATKSEPTWQSNLTIKDKLNKY